MSMEKGIVKTIVLFSSLLISQFTLAETLKEVVARTIFTNPEIRITEKVRNASNEGVKQARAGYFPTVEMTAGYGREQADNVNTVFATNTLWRRDLGFSAKQMLFDGYATYNEVKRNKAKTNADAYKVWGTSEDTALLAIQAYLDVLRTQELVYVAELNLGVHERTYSMVRHLSEQGVGRAADTDQTLGRLELAKANLVTARNNYQDATITFQKVTGDVPHHLLPPPDINPALLPCGIGQAIERAIKNHPTLKSANADILEARGQMEASKSKFYPRFDLVLNVTRNHNVQGVEGPNNDKFAMVQMQYNLFQGGKDVARTRETTFNLEESYETRNRTLRQVVESIRLSWVAYKNASERLPILIKRKQATALTTRAYTKQFDLGKRTILDVLDSQNEFYTSEQDIINERYALLFAKYRLLNGTGILIEHFNLPLPMAAMIPYCKSEIC